MQLLVPPPLVGFLAGLIMWFLAREASMLTFSFMGQREAAYMLIATGFSIDIMAIASFRKAKTTINPLSPEKTSKLVVSGIYRFTRNPMYLGMLIILIGCAIWLGSALNVIVLAAFIAYITIFQIKPEEARLEELFGDELSAYMNKVRRWV